MRERGEFGPSIWFELNAGHEQRAEARWLLPKICDAGSIAKDGIGAIRVQQTRTFVQIAEAVAGRFDATTQLDRDLTMTRLAGEPDLEARAPARAPRPAKPYGERPAKTYEPREERAPKAYEPKTYEPRAPKEGKAPYRPKPARIVEEGEGGSWTPLEADSAPAIAKKPYEKKPYAPRAEGYKPRSEGYKSRDGEGYKPRAEGYKPKSEGFRSHGPKGDGKATGYKSHGAEGGYRPRGEDAPKSFGDRPAKPYAKPYGDKPAGKPYAKSYGDKPARPEGRSEGRSYGDKPAGKSFGAKPYAKPYGDKPAPKPRADASDTSKRFVPPKRKA